MITRTKPLQRSAIKRKPRKKRAGDDPKYLAWIRTLPCVCCKVLGRCVECDAVVSIRETRFQDQCPACGDQLPILVTHEQTSPTECAHVGKRGLGQKCPDRETIPLCGGAHHREGPESHHKMQKRFEAHWGIDFASLITQLNARYESENG